MAGLKKIPLSAPKNYVPPPGGNVTNSVSISFPKSRTSASLSVLSFAPISSLPISSTVKVKDVKNNKSNIYKNNNVCSGRSIIGSLSKRVMRENFVPG